MKKAAWIGILAAAAMVAQSPEARAGDEGWAALGGYVVGSLIGGGGHGHGSYRVGYHSRGHRSGHHVNYRPAPRYYHAPPVRYETVIVENHYAPPPEPEGHYEYQEQRIWVPGSYSYEYDRCGRQIKVWHEGYYRTEQVKVWVPHHRVRTEVRNYTTRY